MVSLPVFRAPDGLFARTCTLSEGRSSTRVTGPCSCVGASVVLLGRDGTWTDPEVDECGRDRFDHGRRSA